METLGAGASEQRAPEDRRCHLVKGSLAHSSVSLPKLPTNIPPLVQACAFSGLTAGPVTGEVG